MKDINDDSLGTMMKGKVVVLTGATGFIGSALVAKLLRESATVVAVFRPGRNGDGARRVRDSLTAMRPFLTERGTLHVVPGDVTREGVFYNREDVERWKGQVDFLCSVAGSIQFFNEQSNQAVNVVGARNMAGLAIDLAVRRFIHFSTAYVCGRRTGLITESDGPSDSYSNSYEESKARGEAEVLNTIRKITTIVRPSIVVGPLSDSWVRSQPPTWEGYYGFFRGFYLLRRKFLREFGDLPGGKLDLMSTRIPGDPMAEINLIPVDSLVRMCLCLMMNDSTVGGKIFHLAHPKGPIYRSLVEKTLSLMHIENATVGVDLDGEKTPLEVKIEEAVTPFLPYVGVARRFSMKKTLALCPGEKIPPIDDYLTIERLIQPALSARFRGIEFQGPPT